MVSALMSSLGQAGELSTLNVLENAAVSTDPSLITGDISKAFDSTWDRSEEIIVSAATGFSYPCSFDCGNVVNSILVSCDQL